jgi:hypothetical protein
MVWRAGTLRTSSNVFLHYEAIEAFGQYEKKSFEM